ncbi:MAG: sodium:solute symporter [Bacteroidia bacterium]|nr:sodium:solute symporter [Bacteroidia bacterium]
MDTAGSLSVATFWMLIAYMTLVLILVIRGAMKTKTLSDYAMGSIQFSPFMVGLSVAAAMTSAATFIINPGIVAVYGWSAFLSYGIFLPLAALAALVVLSKKFRQHGESTGSQTLPQWIGNRFNSKSLRNWFAYLSILLLTFLVLICVGLTQVISAALNADSILVLWLVIAFIFGYMMFGGANIMVYTNTIQALVMIVVALILLFSGLENFSSGWAGFFNRLQAIDPLLTASTRPDSPLFRDYFEIIFAQMIIGFAVVCQPHIITKSMLLKSDAQVNKYLTVAVLVQTLFFLVVFAGFYARLMFPELSVDGSKLATDKIMSVFVVKRFPIVVSLLVIMGLLAAGISTLEGLIQSLSTTLVSDVFKPLFPSVEEQKWFWFHKLTIVMLAMATGFLSMQQLMSPNFSVAMLAQNGVYAFFASAVVPVFCGLFFPKTSSSSLMLAAVLAIFTHFSVYYFSLTPYMQATVKNPAIPASLGILVSALTVLLFGFFGRFKKIEQ